ncbi:GIY-YIG nuclease family protein [Streptomyces sp. NPDC053705]|uniref:GIY-YIG nuclease family protein n=1 Tax=Streptomyces sp. NPDC053705 TaxID=3156668 RepID=UPI0034291CD3
MKKALRVGQQTSKRNAGQNNLIRQTYAATLPAHSDGVVYYVTWRANDDYVKIGTTTDAKQRFHALSRMGPLRFLVAEPGGTTEELLRHNQFGHLRRDGTELFRYTSEIVDHIAELRRRYPLYREIAEVGRSYD